MIGAEPTTDWGGSFTRPTPDEMTRICSYRGCTQEGPYATSACRVSTRSETYEQIPSNGGVRLAREAGPGRIVPFIGTQDHKKPSLDSACGCSIHDPRRVNVNNALAGAKPG